MNTNKISQIGICALSIMVLFSCKLLSCSKLQFNNLQQIATHVDSDTLRTLASVNKRNQRSILLINETIECHSWQEVFNMLNNISNGLTPSITSIHIASFEALEFLVANFNRIQNTKIKSIYVSYNCYECKNNSSNHHLNFYERCDTIQVNDNAIEVANYIVFLRRHGYHTTWYMPM